jgi:period circadian protein 2
MGFFELFLKFLFIIIKRATFSSQITSSVAETKVNNNSKDTKSIHVMLRRYRGLNSSGYGVKNIDVTYDAFKLSFTFRETPADNSNNIFLDQNGKFNQIFKPN